LRRSWLKKPKVQRREDYFELLTHQPDERNQTGILTSGLASLPPSRSSDDQWRWEFVARYSGATVPDFHGVPRHLIAIKMNSRSSVSKSVFVLDLRARIARKISMPGKFIRVAA
jgi:hypothetical protein